MAGSEPESALNEGIEALRAGESVEDVLRRHPEYRSELEPLLRLVVELGSMPRPALSPAAVRAGEARVRRAVAAGRPRLYRPALGWVAAAAAVVMLALLGLGTTVAAAQGRPESPIYGLWVAAERIHQAITQAPSAQADAHLASVERRLDQLAAEAATGRPPAGPALSDLEEKLHTALDKVAELPPPEAASRINRAIGLIARERAIIQASDDNEAGSDRVERLNRRENELTEKLRRLTGKEIPKAGPPAGTPPAGDRGRDGGHAPQGGQNPAGHSGPGRGR